MNRRWLWLLAAPGALIALDMLLRLFGAGAPPAGYCPDGSPRGAARYEARNVYMETRVDAAAKYVVCFGDSWTWGVGLSRDQTWPAQLEKLLRRRDPDIRVVNAAEVDGLAADVAKIFRRLALRYHAHQAVVFVGAQDAIPKSLLEKYPPGDPFRARACPRPLWRLGHLFARRVQWHKFRVDPPESPNGKDVGERRATLAQTQMSLLQIAQTAHDEGIELVLVTYPALPVQKAGAPHLPLENRNNFLIATAAESFDAKVCDLERRWGNRTADYLAPWLLWPQPNATGCADIARAVAEQL